MATFIGEMPKDLNGYTIPAANKVVDVLNVDITAAGWTAITLDASIASKSILAQTRDGANWLLSDIAAGTTYATMRGSISANIGAKGGTIIFYAKGTTSTTLEVIVMD